LIAPPTLNPQLAFFRAALRRAGRRLPFVFMAGASRPVAMNRRRAVQTVARRRFLPVVDINSI
jgi:hypothetical protein